MEFRGNLNLIEMRASIVFDDRMEIRDTIILKCWVHLRISPVLAGCASTLSYKPPFPFFPLQPLPIKLHKLAAAIMPHSRPKTPLRHLDMNILLPFLQIPLRHLPLLPRLLLPPQAPKHIPQCDIGFRSTGHNLHVLTHLLYIMCLGSESPKPFENGGSEISEGETVSEGDRETRGAFLVVKDNG